MSDIAPPLLGSTASETDLLTAIRQLLERSPEPLTLVRIHSALPAAFRTLSPEALEEILQRQVGAGVLYQYPKYRSQYNRYWDRPMSVHLAQLLREVLRERPLTLAELRRQLPDYAKPHVEAAVEQEVAQGRLFVHPAGGRRGGPRYGLQRPDPKNYLREELAALFARLEPLGFTQAELRAGALELLHEEEWAAPPAATPAAGDTAPATAAAHTPTPSSAPELAAPPASAPPTLLAPEDRRESPGEQIGNV
jgi:hypothetical protein